MTATDSSFEDEFLRLCRNRQGLFRLDISRSAQSLETDLCQFVLGSRHQMGTREFTDPQQNHRHPHCIGWVIARSRNHLRCRVPHDMPRRGKRRCDDCRVRSRATVRSTRSCCRVCRCHPVAGVRRMDGDPVDDQRIWLRRQPELRVVRRININTAKPAAPSCLRARSSAG